MNNIKRFIISVLVASIVLISTNNPASAGPSAETVTQDQVAGTKVENTAEQTFSTETAVNTEQGDVVDITIDSMVGNGSEAISLEKEVLNSTIIEDSIITKKTETTDTVADTTEIQDTKDEIIDLDTVDLDTVTIIIGKQSYTLGKDVDFDMIVTKLINRINEDKNHICIGFSVVTMDESASDFFTEADGGFIIDIE